MSTAPPDEDAAWAASREAAAFSNGTEWDIWAARWCDRCEHDADMLRGGRGTGCPLVLIGLLGRTPAEWRPVTPGGHDYTCSAFTAHP